MTFLDDLAVCVFLSGILEETCLTLAPGMGAARGDAENALCELSVDFIILLALSWYSKIIRFYVAGELQATIRYMIVL